MTLHYQSAGRTETGKVRRHNEDSILVRDDVGLWVVADGLGGHAAGDYASQMIVERLGRVARNGSVFDFIESIEDSLQQTNADLVATALERGSDIIGSTVVVLVHDKDFMLCGWVGDSRAYRLNRGVLTALTEDHSYVQRLIQLGQIDPADHASYPRRNALYRVLGQHDELDVDLIACPLEAGDHLLLCSDGLWDAVPEAALANLLADQGHHTSPAARAAHLVALADKAGGKDNSTAVVIEITGEQA